MRFIRAFALLAVIACGGDGPTAPTPNSIAGTWSLQSINGTGLPYVVLQIGSDKLELTSDVITVTASGSFTQVTTVRTTQGGQVTTESSSDAGTYSLNGTAVSFVVNSDGSTGTGVLSGNNMSVGADGVALIYRKQ